MDSYLVSQTFPTCPLGVFHSPAFPLSCCCIVTIRKTVFISGSHVHCTYFLKCQVTAVLFSSSRYQLCLYVKYYILRKIILTTFHRLSLPPQKPLGFICWETDENLILIMDFCYLENRSMNWWVLSCSFYSDLLRAKIK